MNDETNDCIKFIVVIAHLSLYINWTVRTRTDSLTYLSLVFFVSHCWPLILKSPVPLEKKQLLEFVLVFEQWRKQRQLYA